MTLKLSAILFATTASILGFASSTLLAQSAADLLRVAEKIRNPDSDYQLTVELEDQLKGGIQKYSYKTYISGRSKALVEFVSPAVDVGTKVLLVDLDMWIYVPTSAKPLRISAKQKVAGNASYGDITRLSFVDNYTATLAGEGEVNKTSAIILDLTAIEGRQVTYDKIQYWIDKRTKRPIKAIFKTIADKPLRECTYTNFKNVFGVDRPTRFVITDANNRAHVTTLDFLNAKKRRYVSGFFDQQNLNRP